MRQQNSVLPGYRRGALMAATGQGPRKSEQKDNTMNVMIAPFRLAKHMARIIFLTALLLPATAQAETPEAAPGIRPIESLWFASTRHFPRTSEADAALTKHSRSGNRRESSMPSC